MATIKAVMFDFDGVLFDTEPLHFEMFRQVLRMEGVTLAPDRYHARYVGLTDQACFRAVLTDSGWTAVTAETLDRLVQCKTGLMQDALRKTLPVLSGVREFVAAVTETCRTAIASGALRQEIALCLELAGMTSMFEHISAAQDVRQGKSWPDGGGIFVHRRGHADVAGRIGMFTRRLSGRQEGVVVPGPVARRYSLCCLPGFLADGRAVRAAGRAARDPTPVATRRDSVPARSVARLVFFTGRSRVTTATLSMHVVKDQI